MYPFFCLLWLRLKKEKYKSHWSATRSGLIGKLSDSARFQNILLGFVGWCPVDGDNFAEMQVRRNKLGSVMRVTHQFVRNWSAGRPDRSLPKWKTSVARKKTERLLVKQSLPWKHDRFSQKHLSQFGRTEALSLQTGRSALYKIH